MIDLENKVVVVTGGCGLLGRMFVRTILTNNGRVVIADINREGGNQFTADLVRDGFNSDGILFSETAITDINAVKRLIEDTHQKFGKIDVLVNNAHPRNANYSKHLEDSLYEDFCENLGNHLGGYFLCMQQFSKYFSKQGWGNTISMSSIYGIVPPRFDIYEDADFTMPVDYAPIKSGIVHLTKYFARYYKNKNMRFNCISPGGVFNNQHPSFVEKYNTYGTNKGMLNPEDLNGTMLFLISDHSKYINGQNLVVDDGWSL